MKVRSSIIFLPILALFSLTLTSCGTAPASPALTPAATQTATLEIPTQTLSPTSTPVEPQLPESMTEKYLEKFEKIEEGTKQINGQETNVIYGINADGTKLVIAMEIEVDGKKEMMRVGEYTDDAGFSYYTMMGEINGIDGSMGGRFQVTDETAEKLFAIDEGKNAVNIWNSLASQWGLTPQQARDRVMIDNKGFAKFNVAVGIPTSNADFPSKSESLPNKANFNLPIEMITIATKSDFEQLPDNIKNRVVYDHSLDEGEPVTGALIGSLVWIKDNGQIQIISIGTPIDNWNVLNPDQLKESERKYVNSYLAEHINPQILLLIDIISNPTVGVPKTGVNGFINQSSNLFEIDGFVNSSSQ